MDDREGPAPPPGGLLPVLKEGLDRLGPDRGAAVLLLGGSPSDREVQLERLFRDAEARKVHVVRLESHPYDQQVPFGALLPWLSRLVASRRALKEPFETELPSLILAGILGGEAAPVPRREANETSSSSVEDTADGPRVDPEDVRTGLLDLVEGRVRQNPTLLSIDHAERLDLASQEWLRRLSSQLERLPLLLVLTFDAAPSRPSGPGWVTAMAPPPLLEQLPEVPESDGSSAKHPLPHARESRRVLSAVAAAGPEATPKFLSEVLELPLGDVERTLGALQGEGWLRAREGVWHVPPDRSPRVSELSDHAADASLHHAMARAMERAHPKPRGATLLRIADHWERAVLADPGVERMLGAVRECDRWGAPEVGEGRLQRALVLAQNDPSLRGRELEERVYAQLGSFRMRAEDPAGCVQALRRAYEISGARGAPRRERLPYLALIAIAEVNLGHDPEEELKRGLAEAHGKFRDEEAALLRAYGGLLSIRGRSAEALEMGERSCALADQGTNISLRMRCHLDLAGAYLLAGEDPEKAREHLMGALEHRERVAGTPHQTIVVEVLATLAEVDYNLRRYPEALARGEEALREARRTAARSSLMTVLGNVGEYACAAREFPRAEELAKELRRYCDRAGGRVPETHVDRLQLGLLEASIDMGLGRFKEAKRGLEELVAAAEKGGVRYFVAQAMVVEAELAHRQGDASEVREVLRRIRRDGLWKVLGQENRVRLTEIERSLDRNATGKS